MSASAPSGASRIVVHADDLGETDEITRGILLCIDAGVVTSTSILANMPGTRTALAEAARRGRQASFGVHLNLCEGRSLTRPASFARPDGTFLPKRELFVRAVAGKLDLVEVGNEMAAQIELIAGAGVEVSHLDSHKHMHQLPGVSLVVATVARRFDIDRARCTIEEGWWPRGTPPGAALARLVRRVLARKLSVRLREQGVRSPGRAFDLRELMGRTGREGKLRLLRRPAVITEMFCHPATALADREKPGSCSRHEESTYLRSGEFRGLLDEAGARLVTYWEV